jgi:hypothetical protein
MTSWIAILSASFILSNSSMHTTPLSARTIAPASKYFSPFMLVVTAAVRLSCYDPPPLILIARGAISMICLSNYDLAVDGSPTIRRFISPLK